jgi:N-acetylmuramoyl-L-alanine amidase
MFRAVLFFFLISIGAQGSWAQSASPSHPLIVLDPGHGGIDPGAIRDGHREADLMLRFTRELAEELLRSGRFEVRLTRDSDHFLGLNDRVDVARNAQAVAFLSFHADALTEGHARGAAVYTLSDEASDETAAELVRIQSRHQVLAGQDLSGAEDDITGVLVDLAQGVTRPRSDALAAHLLSGFGLELGGLHHDTVRSAGFTVLKSPDIPSVLIELGFMSDEGDLKNLTDPQWRRSAVIAIRNSLIRWYDADQLVTNN